MRHKLMELCDPDFSSDDEGLSDHGSSRSGSNLSTRSQPLLVEPSLTPAIKKRHISEDGVNTTIPGVAASQEGKSLFSNSLLTPKRDLADQLEDIEVGGSRHQDNKLK